MMNDVDLQKWLIQAVRISLLCEKYIEYYYYNMRNVLSIPHFKSLMLDWKMMILMILAMR